ncbi:MAG: hypothetical protein LDL41_10480 [Coleofasciculus sp. S288]|nr:hypothetical protein [Coleofasciculus sp. S288]
MLSLEIAFVLILLLMVFPFTMVQMRAAIDQEDIEVFYIWMCVASAIAGLPFMVTFLP